MSHGSVSSALCHLGPMVYSRLMISLRFDDSGAGPGVLDAFGWPRRDTGSQYLVFSELYALYIFRIYTQKKDGTPRVPSS